VGSPFGLTSEGVESKQWVVFETPSGLLAYTLTGVVKLTMKGDGAQFRRDKLTFTVPIPDLPPRKGLKFVHWAPFVTLNSISNDNAAYDAGWAVDDFGLESTGGAMLAVSVFCHLAIRDVDGFILRLGYVIHLLGSLEDLPAPPK
jgi:hypothetical protein